MTHALRNEETTKKIELSENLWFITEVLSVDKDAMILLPTFKFNDHSALFLQRVTCLKIIRFHLMTGQGQCYALRCCQEHHHQLLQEQDLSPVIHGDDNEHC